MKQVRFADAVQNKDKAALGAAIRVTAQQGKIASALVDRETTLYIENSRDVVSFILYCMAVLFDQQQLYNTDNAHQIAHMKDCLSHLINEPLTSPMSTYIVRKFAATFKNTLPTASFDAWAGLFLLKNARIFSRNVYTRDTLADVIFALQKDDRTSVMLSQRMDAIKDVNMDNLYQTKITEFLLEKRLAPSLDNILIFLINTFVSDLAGTKGIYHQQGTDMLLQLLVTHDNMDESDKDEVVEVFKKHVLIDAILMYTNKHAPDVYCFATM